MTSPLPQDFGDWISPILVKELRQGLRTRIFTGAFITLQTILMLFMLASMGENTEEEFITGAFWTLLYLTLLVVMPLRGLNALSLEIKNNTLDLLSLTRLDALRICFGKWAALFTQAVLFAIAVLPYVVLRYFSGGIDMLRELSLLGIGLGLCALLCAISIVLSSLPNALTRSLLVAGFVFSLFSFSGQLLFGTLVRPGGFSVTPPGWIWFWAFLWCAFLIFFCISAAASRIAPPAQNFSTLRRGVAFLGILVGLLLAILAREEYIIFAYVLFGLITADALTENTANLSSVHRPLLRLPPLGRVVQFLFAPGWYSGVFFVGFLLLLFVVVGILFDLFTTDPGRVLNIHLGLAGVILFPPLMTQLLTPNTRDRFTPYLFIQLGLLTLGGFFMMLGASSDSDALTWLGSPIPSTSFYMALSDDHGNDGVLTLISSISLLVIVTFLLRLGLQDGRAMLSIRPSPSHDA